MSETIGTAYIQIEPSTQGLSGSISSVLNNEATTAGTSAGNRLSSALGSAAKVGVTAVAGLTTAIAGAGTALVSAASNTAQYGDNIDKMSQKLGISSSFYQEWDAVLQHSGTSMSSMTSTFKTLANVASDTTDAQSMALAKLGLTAEDLGGSAETAFTTIITKLQGMEEGTERSAIAQDLLGKGAVELGALLNTSAADTQTMIDTVNQLGGVMDENGVKASAAFQDSLQDMQTAFTGVKNTALSELLPSFTQVMDGITGLVTGADNADQTLEEGIQGLASSISEKIPTIIESFGTLAKSIMEVAPEIISSLAEGIIDAIPKLSPTLVQLVTDIGQMIIENLPSLIKAALEVVLELAKGIADSLPELIPTIVDVVLQITDTLIDNVDLLVDGAIALIVGLADGIINALPKLIEKAPEIVIKLGDAIIQNAPKLVEAAIELILTLQQGFMDSVPKLLEAVPSIIQSLKNQFDSSVSAMLEIGEDLVNGIKTGIENAWNHLVSWLEDLCGNLVDKVKNALKIGSPSKVFADEVGKWIPEGIGVGITANADSVTESIDSLNDKTLNAANDFTTDYAGYEVSTASTETANNDYIGIVESIENAIISAMSSIGIYMDSTKVGNLVAGSVDYQLGKISARRV